MRVHLYPGRGLFFDGWWSTTYQPRILCINTSYVLRTKYRFCVCCVVFFSFKPCGATALRKGDRTVCTCTIFSSPSMDQEQTRSESALYRECLSHSSIATFVFRSRVRYARADGDEIRRSGSGNGNGHGSSPLKPVVLRPRPSQSQLEGTAPYNSIFSRRRQDDEGEEQADVKVADADGSGVSLPHGTGHTVLGRRSGTGSSWATPDSAPAAAAAVAATVTAAAGSSLVAEAGSVGDVMSPPPPVVSKSRDDSGLGEEGPPQVGAETAPYFLPQQRHSLGSGGGQGGERGENGEEGRVSVATSSTSTLPPLDQELSELLER